MVGIRQTRPSYDRVMFSLLLQFWRRVQTPEAGDIRAVLERRGDDRAICRAAAKASERVVSAEHGALACISSME